MALTQVTTRGIAKGVEIVLSGGLTGDPSISWQNDEDTGLYSSNAGYTDFTSNGTTVLSIGPDGFNFPSGADAPFKFNGSTIVTCLSTIVIFFVCVASRRGSIDSHLMGHRPDRI